MKHGVGGLNIDGSRVSHSEPQKTTVRKQRSAGWNTDNTGFDSTNNFTASADPQGRFPANLIHDGSDEVLEVFPESNSGKGKATTYEKHGGQWGKGMQIRNADFGDSGSAARFFYTAKASKSERNAGLDGFEDKIQNRNTFNANSYAVDFRHPDGGYERKHDTVMKNHHPTVKPLALTKYLANLIKPPKGGRLLVPFSGSGSEMIGALQAGWEYVEGVELTEEYIPIAEARIKHWMSKIQEAKENEQPSLFDV